MLPGPLLYVTKESAEQALDEIGEIQRKISFGPTSLTTLENFGDYIFPRLLGVMNYLEAVGATGIYPKFVEPFAEWAVSALGPLFIEDQDTTPVSRAARTAFLQVQEFHGMYYQAKYR